MNDQPDFPERPERRRRTRRLTAVGLAVACAGCQFVPGPGQGHVDATETVVETAAPAVDGRGHPGFDVDRIDANTVSLGYTDIAGADRSVAIEVRLPDQPAGTPVPVVVWSHGGSAGKSNPSVVAERWGRAFTSSGFAFVAIAHRGRSVEARRAVCGAVVADVCDEFNTLLWDRPVDVGVVLDWLEAEAGGLGIDPSRLIYGGHSAGAIGVMRIAGLAWPFGSVLHPPSDPRPVAFIAASPLGAEARQVDVDDLAGIDRPVLFLTGAGDTTSGTEAVDRRATFDLLPDEPTGFMLWADDRRARHSVFNLETKACERSGGTPADCRAIVRTVGRVGIEFGQAAVDPNGYDPTALDRLVASSLPAGYEWASTTP